MQAKLRELYVDFGDNKGMNFYVDGNENPKKFKDWLHKELMDNKVSYVTISLSRPDKYLAGFPSASRRTISNYIRKFRA